MPIFRRSALLLSLLALVVPGIASAASPKVGDQAPDFLLHGTDGALYRLSEHVGKRGVVLAWFPKAFTPG
jgi:peroxiredoxin Q/BCP